MKKCLVPLVLLLITHCALSQVDFAPKAFADPNFRHINNCVVDMNGDFLDDIVAISNDVMAIYYQQEDATFEKRVFRIPFQSLPYWSIAAADIDENGFNDLGISDGVSVSFLVADENGGNYTEDFKSEDIFGQRASFADINNDGNVDAFFCNDVNQNHPYVNDGAGNMRLDFDLIYTPEDLPGNYAVIWTDYDNDDDMDMYLTKCVQDALPGEYSRTNLLYQNQGDHTFLEVGTAAGMDDNSQSWITIFEDFDNDGDFDAIILNHDFGHRFMRNNLDGTFTDIISQTNIPSEATDVREALAADFDNNGFVDFMTDVPSRIYYNMGNFNFVQEDLEYTLGALGDFNNDGFVDYMRSTLIYENQGNDNHWITINLTGEQSNRNGIGARCELYGAWGRQIREVRSTQGYLAMSSLSTHFGIGSNERIDSLIIKWPSGVRTKIIEPEIDRTLNIHELGCSYSRPQLSLSGDTFLCAGETIDISTAASGSILWSTGETSQSITVDGSGTYNATITDSNGCTSISETVSITDAEDPIQIFAPFGTEICGGSTVLLEVDVTSPLTWNTGSANAFLYADEAGDYSVTITSDCPEPLTSDTITIEEIPIDPPTVMDVTYQSGVGNFAVTVESDLDLVFWWSDTLNTTFIGDGKTIFFSENFVTGDTTFYVQACMQNAGVLCCSELVPINVFFTATSELARSLGVRIYPNPAREVINVDFERNNEAVTGYLYDHLGRTLFETAQDFSDSRNQIPIDHLAPGSYLLEIRVGTDRIFEKIIISD